MRRRGSSRRQRERRLDGAHQRAEAPAWPAPGADMTSIAEERKVVARRAHSHVLAETIFRFRELGIVLALVIVVGATTIDNHRFLSATSIQNLLSGAAIIALLAIGETMVIVTRNVDLSIGSVLGISAYAVGVVYRDHPHVPMGFVFLVALGIGLACGIVNGAIVTVARVPSLVVTLGTLYVIRGIDGAWAGGNQVNASMLPESFNKIGYGTVLGVPYLAIIAIVAVAIATYAMRSFRTARDFYAIAGVGYEFQVITAVVIGGVAIFGASGNVLGAAVGALLRNTLYSALV